MTWDDFIGLAFAAVFGTLIIAFVYWGWKFASLAYYEERLKLEKRYKTEDLKDLK